MARFVVRRLLNDGYADKADIDLRSQLLQSLKSVTAGRIACCYLPRTIAAGAMAQGSDLRMPNSFRDLVALFFTATSIVTLSQTAAAEEIPAIEPDANGVFFILGKEDGYRYGYRASGWAEVDEHGCNIGLDCHSKPFPSHLRTASGKAEWADTAVERLAITFRFDAAYDDVTLRLVRAGAETIVVSLDERDEILLTKSMMEPPTHEHSDFGAHDLKLGRLDAGLHVLRLSVAEDGEGNARFGWDSIQLRTTRH